MTATHMRSALESSSSSAQSADATSPHRSAPVDAPSGVAVPGLAFGSAAAGQAESAVAEPPPTRLPGTAVERLRRIAANRDAPARSGTTPLVIRRFPLGDGEQMQAEYGFRSNWIFQNPTLTQIFTGEAGAMKTLVATAKEATEIRAFLIVGAGKDPAAGDPADIARRWGLLKDINAALTTKYRAINVGQTPAATHDLDALATRIVNVTPRHRAHLQAAKASKVDIAALASGLDDMEAPAPAELTVPAAIDLAQASGNAVVNPNLRKPARRAELAAALLRHPPDSVYPKNLPWGDGDHGDTATNIREHARKHAILGSEKDTAEPLTWWAHLQKYDIPADQFPHAPADAFDNATQLVTDATAAAFFTYVKSDAAEQDTLLGIMEARYRDAALAAAADLSSVMVTAGGDKIFLAGQNTAHGIFVIAAWTPAGFTISSAYFNTKKIVTEQVYKVWNLAS